MYCLYLTKIIKKSLEITINAHRSVETYDDLLVPSTRIYRSMAFIVLFTNLFKVFVFHNPSNFIRDLFVMLFRFAFTLDESLKSVMIEKFIIIVINTNVMFGTSLLPAKNLNISFQ